MSKYFKMNQKQLIKEVLNAVDDEIYGLDKSDLDYPTVHQSWTGGASCFDPLNNDNHILPIIIRHEISMLFVDNGWDASVDNGGDVVVVFNENYRLAAIACFLELMEIKNG